MVSSRARALGAILLVGMLAAALPVAGSVLRGLTLRDLRTGSDVIVSGRVVGVRSERTATSIDTLARVRVETVHQGEAGRIVTVRLPGGTAEGKRLIVPGSPSLQRGERVVLFLYRDGADFRPVGLFQGVWSIDPENPDVARASNSGGAALLRPETGTPAVSENQRSVSWLVGKGAAQ